MIFKLAIKNLRRSMRDYSVYFLTLSLSVMLFYVFGSVDHQLLLLKFNADAKIISKNLGGIINGFSAIVFIILFFLIKYANNFLVRRRQKEFATYLLLGMSNRRMATILVCETLLMGLMALGTGLVFGLIVSQVSSVLMAYILKAPIAYGFTYSQTAFSDTVFSFSFIFASISIFNIRKMFRLNLVTLMRNTRKQEQLKKGGAWFGWVGLLGACALLYLAYRWVLVPTQIIVAFFPIVLIGTLGSLLFFYALANLFMNSLKWFEMLWYRNINVFVFRQVGSRIQSSFKMMGFMSVLLLFSCVFLITGFTLNRFLGDETKGLAPYAYSAKTDADQQVKEQLKASFPSFEYYYELEGYRVNTPGVSERNPVNRLIFVKLSAYNALRQFYGYELLEIQANQIYRHDDGRGILQLESLDKGSLEANLDLLGTPFQVEKIPQKSSFMLSNTYVYPEVYVVADAFIETALKDHKMIVKASILNFSIPGDQALVKQVLKTFPLDISTRESAIQITEGPKVFLTYAFLYLGVVLFVCTIVVLALHVLSDVSDNKGRYRVLSRLGVYDMSIDHSLAMLITVQFLAPFLLAALHTFFGVKVIFMHLKFVDASFNVEHTVIFMMLMIALVYGIFIRLTVTNAQAILNRDRQAKNIL